MAQKKSLAAAPAPNPMASHQEHHEVHRTSDNRSTLPAADELASDPALDIALGQGGAPGMYRMAINPVDIDPLFVKHVLAHRGETDDRTDFWRHSLGRHEDLAPSASNTGPAGQGQPPLRTEFQLQFPRNACAELWPANRCLFSVILRKEEACSRRLFIWQETGFLVCGMVETTARLDILAGHFFSSADPFILDRHSELHSIGYYRMAKRLIIQDVVEVISPMASHEMGVELGHALAEKLNTASAEQFLDGLVSALLSAAQPKKS